MRKTKLREKAAIIKSQGLWDLRTKATVSNNAADIYELQFGGEGARTEPKQSHNEATCDNST